MDRAGKAEPRGLVGTLKRTALEYGEASSLHGIHYIFESGKEGLFSSRLIWVLVVLTASLTGTIWSIEASAFRVPKNISLGVPS